MEITRFFTFIQTEVGGVWDRDYGYAFIVEAIDYEDANLRAKRAGLNFFDKGRWVPQWPHEHGTERPEVHGRDVEAYVREDARRLPCVVLYMDGKEDIYKRAVRVVEVV